MYGVNINDKQLPFTDWILSGLKTIETRDTDSLRSKVGQTVGIVRTGKGQAQLVGFCVIGEPIFYHNEMHFRHDEHRHLVKSGSRFDIKKDKFKFGYPLTEVTRLRKPVDVHSKGIVFRKLDVVNV